MKKFNKFFNKLITKQQINLFNLPKFYKNFKTFIRLYQIINIKIIIIF